MPSNVAREQRGAAARVLADAFAGDAIWQEVRPRNPARADRALYLLFRAEVEICARMNGYLQATYDADRHPTAVLIAYERTSPKFPWWAWLFRIPAMLVLGISRTLLMARMLSVVEKTHPTEPHFYFWYVGARTLGGGAALIKRVMKVARAEGLPGYGEAKSPEVAEMCEILGWTAHPPIEIGAGHKVTPVWWRPTEVTTTTPPNDPADTGKPAAGTAGPAQSGSVQTGSTDPEPAGPIARIAGACARAPKLVLVLAGVAFLVFGSLGGLVSERLSAGGFLDPDAESSQVADLLAAEHGVANMQLIFAVRDPEGVAGQRARGAAGEIATALRGDERVSTVTSYTDPAGAILVSRDGTTGLVVAGLVADDNEAQTTARELADRLTGERDGVTVLAGGQAMAFEEINATAEADLLLAEGIAVPITFLLLVLFLRSVIAAAVPVIAGVLAIVGTTGVLFVITFLTELSVFALNVTTALGLALAIDYSLLLIGRYREEISRGAPHEQALVSAMRHGGRAVVFSGVIVATALIGLWLFPITFLRSIGYAGVAVVALSVLIALTCVPALLALWGPRMNRKPQREAVPAEQTGLYRIARVVQKRPLVLALPVLAVLLLAGSPVLDLRLGLPDDRVLSTEAQSRQVGDIIRADFDQNMTGTVDIVLTDAPADRLGDYAALLSEIPGVTAVADPTGTYVDGAPVGPPVGAIGPGGSAHLAVATDVDPYSDAGADLVEALRAVEAPGEARVGGLAQQSADTAAGISDGLVAAILWIAITSALLLFMLTGSLLLPFKALVLNTLSLAATFGALVWIFQEGHLDGLGTTATGFTVATVPVLLFCVAFGLSMDYEVFLLARFTEEWERSERTRADVDTAVAVGLARSGRVVTAAALLMAVVFLGIATSDVALMRALGIGLALAVIVDATLVRMILVPAAMRVAGRANWWTPGRLAPVVRRVRIRE